MLGRECARASTSPVCAGNMYIYICSSRRWQSGPQDATSLVFVVSARHARRRCREHDSLRAHGQQAGPDEAGAVLRDPQDGRAVCARGGGHPQVPLKNRDAGHRHRPARPHRAPRPTHRALCVSRSAPSTSIEGTRSSTDGTPRSSLSWASRARMRCAHPG